MSFSGTDRPDLDWSQIRETVKLLAVSVAQVERGMSIGDDSVNTLAKSFTEMSDDMSALRDILMSLEANDQLEKALYHCAITQEKIYSAIVAFQFYDRLQQRLQHVSLSLKGLSDIIETPNRLYNPFEWKQFQVEIRERYTMEAEKVMFDAILQGKSVEEAIVLAAEFDGKAADEDEIELF